MMIFFVSRWIYQVSVESSSGRDLKRNHLIVRIKLQNLLRRMAEDHSSTFSSETIVFPT
jgi:hypothetical protein